MTIRPTQNSNFDLVHGGLALNFSKLIRAQEQVASGKRILRPSDDPVGAARALTLRRQLSEVARHAGAAQSARPALDASLSALDEAGGVLSEARTLVLTGLNGTLAAGDRASLAESVGHLKARLLELANSKFDGLYLFGGTATGSAPFETSTNATPEKVVYAGDAGAPSISIGSGADVTIAIPGSEVFASFDPRGVSYVGSTGVAAGTSADEGSGYDYVEVRHDATSGTLGSGLALAGGGAGDTFLGTRALVVDSAAGTVRFGDGPAVLIPSPAASDLALTDEHGAVLRLDMSGWDGTDFSGTLTGAGSISLDGVTFTALDFVNADLELTDSETGAIVHVDTRAIVRAGTELLTFDGTVNAFDALQGIVDDLSNVDGLSVAELSERLSSRLAELDRNFESFERATGTLGARAQRLDEAQSRLADIDLNLRSVLTGVEDVDVSSAILDMTRAEQTLELAQATGARLLQRTLLDYLR